MSAKPMTFADALAPKTAAAIPRRHVTLPPSAFSDKWEAKPAGAISVGLRSIGLTQVSTARGTAADKAWELHDKKGDDAAREVAYEDHLMAYVVAFGACDPNDRNNGHFTVDNVAKQLNPDGIRLLYDAYEAFSIEESPLVKPATDGEIHEMGRAVQRGAIDRLSRSSALRVRKLLAFVIAELEAPADEDIDMSPADVAGAFAEENVRTVHLRS